MRPEPLPLVLLHGLLGDERDWQPVTAALPGRRCYPLALPGHGGNRALRPHDFDGVRRWLARALAGLGLGRYLLAGYSLGGRLALDFASREPPGLCGLLLENAHPGLPETERGARLAHDAAWAARFARESLPLVLADWYRQPVFASLDEARRQALIRRRQGNSGAAVAAMLEACSLGRQPDLRPWLARTRLPLAYLSGRQDPKFHRLAGELAAASPRLHHFILDGGHNLHADRPLEVARCLRHWSQHLDGVPS